MIQRLEWLYGADHALAFRTFATLYFAAAVVFVFTIQLRQPGLRTQLTFQILTDIVMITGLANASGGISGGMGLLLLVTLASAGLVGQGRLALLYASMASLAMLGMHAFRILQWQAQPQGFLQIGMLCLGYFAVASLAHFLTRRALQSEQATREKARELAMLNRIHALAAGDSTDGLLAVNAAGQVAYCNPHAARLLGQLSIQPGASLSWTAPVLLAHLDHWRLRSGPASVLMPENFVRIRFLQLDESGSTLIMLEDPARAEALAQQVKLAALGRLTLNVAHEIRNPLSAISHAAQLLDEDVQSSPLQKLTAIIQKNVYRLDRIVQDILTINRSDRQPKENLELSEEVRTWLSEWQTAEEIPENAVITHMQLGAQANFNSQHLYQILWNLASNAWRHSSRQPGCLQLTIGREDQAPFLEICDDGPGVDETVLPQLFEPFYTTDPKGTGLGLYIARELARANNAKLEFTGNFPGACFRLRLPPQPAKEQPT